MKFCCIRLIDVMYQDSNTKNGGEILIHTYMLSILLSFHCKSIQNNHHGKQLLPYFLSFLFQSDKKNYVSWEQKLNLQNDRTPNYTVYPKMVKKYRVLQKLDLKKAILKNAYFLPSNDLKI